MDTVHRGAPWRTRAVATRRHVGVIVAVLVGILAIGGCGSSSETTTTTTRATTTTVDAEATGLDALTGSWERTGGDYSVLQGMVVEVGEPPEGVITEVPRNPFQFRVGDVKWTELSMVSGGRIRVRDLSRDADTGATSYVTGFITITNGNTMLEISFPSTGTFQVWTRSP